MSPGAPPPLLTLCPPLCPPQRPITTLCWGHRDSRLFLACGPALYVVRVEHRVAGLQLLCQQGIGSALREEKDAAKLAIPARLCSYVTAAFAPTIKVSGRKTTTKQNQLIHLSLTNENRNLLTKHCFEADDGKPNTKQKDGRN